MDGAKKKTVVTLGEVMLRLSPPGYATLSQAHTLDLVYGGGEANVAIALAYMGVHAKHITRFPDTNVGRSATQYLRHHWIDTSEIIYGDKNLGIYFLEKGTIHRPSEVVYQRADSAFSKIQPDMIDWKRILAGADWFHWTGITPAISEVTAACCAEAIHVANDLNIPVSGDFHSRASLWNPTRDQVETLKPLMQGTDIAFTSQHDIEKQLSSNIDTSTFESCAKALMAAYPRIKKVIDKDRISLSASHNRIKGKLWNGHELLESNEYDIQPIVDRVGTGDAFAAGLIYGLVNGNSDAESINIASATCSIKHSVEGDANVVSVDTILNLVKGDTSGKIKR
jgi:2-dehydro-3-deoxygluconokinase